MTAPAFRGSVLLAEDEEEIRTLVALLFRAEGFAVFEAGDGVEALETFTRNRDSIIAVVTDLGLPRLGGVDLIQRIRAASPGVRIIGTSGYGEADVYAKVLAAGGDDFLPKPFQASALITLVKRLTSP
jgi:hypothetical protein